MLGLNRVSLRSRVCLATILLAVLTSCMSVPTQHFGVLSHTGVQPCGEDAECQAERDEIYSLLAYLVVLKDWQTEADEGTPRKRGHNIGSVLVDPAGNVVFWARNCNAITRDSSQHGEVRLMRAYLANRGGDGSDLEGYTIYTTLEPCAMCTGMMSLTKVARGVYGQADPAYGQALERLGLESWRYVGQRDEAGRPKPEKASDFQEAYSPYPRLFASIPAPTEFRAKLDASFQAFLATAGASKSITDYLLTDEARAIYQEAKDKFERLSVSPKNERALEQAKALLAKVPDHYVRFRFDDRPQNVER
jgi:tRNA(adenine34) deaminase